LRFGSSGREADRAHDLRVRGQEREGRGERVPAHGAGRRDEHRIRVPRRHGREDCGGVPNLDALVPGEGTTPYESLGRNDSGCAYDYTCHEGRAYDTATSTCKTVCAPGETLSADGLSCSVQEPTIVTETVTVTVYVCADGSEVSQRPLQNSPYPLLMKNAKMLL